MIQEIKAAEMDCDQFIAAQVIELLRQGDKAGAMKAFMHENGASLKDAKNFIESLPV